MVDVSSREVSVVGVDRLEAYGGEEVRVTGGSIGVESLGRLDGVAAGGVSLTTEDAVLRAPGAAEAYMGSGVVGVSSSLAVHAGSSLGVSTGVLSLSVEGGVEAVSGSDDELARGVAECGVVESARGVYGGRRASGVWRCGGLRV